jgi:excinuclease ABC subunit C
MSALALEAPPPASAVTAPALTGASLIRDQLRHLPNAPGVYRMIDAKGGVLYVGKAKSLKRRVVAYTKPQALPARLQRMVALTTAMEFVTTASEVEALLLEANLIKRYRPTFNIVLRDDKSFPYLYLRWGHDFPMIGKHRGAKRQGADYFGPFASAGAVNETLNALLRAFPLRSCRDSIFDNRTRPCLQYQIKRCSAPCVGRIEKDDYARIVEDVRGFLGGATREVQAKLQAEMGEAADRLDFEKAAVLRDRLKAIAHIAAKQGINTAAVEDADVVAAHEDGGQVCVQAFFYRAGRNYGNRAYYPAHTKEAGLADVLAAFLAQFYSERLPPKLVLVSIEPSEAALLAEALALKAGHKVEIREPKRGPLKDLVEIARRNAKEALARRLADHASQARLLEQLADRFELDAVPERVEVYDNSHIQGTNAVGSFIVAGPEGLDKKQYRTFTIKAPETGTADDYAMMREVLTRRFTRLLKEDPDRQSGTWPDLVLVDGGAGQLSAAQGVLDELGIEGVELIGVAKGPDRDAGRERFFRTGRDPVMLDARDPVLYLLQRWRDEAHRFAITRHRGKRAKAMGQSQLDAVPGIGGKRKKALLQHFGSARDVAAASLDDLEQVPGLGKAVARAIHDHFHEGSS